MGKKQTVLHSSTESEIISLDAGLRLDWIPALHTIHQRKQSRRVINVLDNVDFISSNVHFSHQEALLYVFEDNEAVSDQDDHKGKKPDNETCFLNPQSCS